MAVEVAPVLLELIRIQPSSLFIRRLSARDLQQLAASATVQIYPARASIFRTGQPVKDVYLILTGVWKISQAAETGGVTNLEFISAGQVSGVYSMLGATAYTFSADAIAPSRVLRWSAPVLRDLATLTPQFAWNICEIFARSASQISDRYSELMTLSAKQRIAHAIVRLAEQLGKRDGCKWIIDTPISLETLAGYSGTTSFTMSRILSRWQREGLLHRNRNFVILYDLEAIQSIADAVDVSTSEGRCSRGSLITSGEISATSQSNQTPSAAGY
jgi:CRP/FNR family transcriptional regulator, nitrogen oxide reductase regulator